MSEKQLTGRMTRVGKSEPEWYRVRLVVPKGLRTAFREHPEKMMTQFLRRQGHKVNWILVRPKRGRLTKKGLVVDYYNGHLHFGAWYCGWV
jgi:hypothetical protein